jgi:peptidoglycan/LPS O-acetylase OafA/YrhL
MAANRLLNSPTPTFIHLDMARALAALAVLLGHLRSFVFLPYGELKSHGPVDTAVWVITGFGHQAVMIFFVLSGFFITRSILVDDRVAGFSWPIYLIKRLTRLWIVLLPCLILTLLWDRIGMVMAGPSFYEGNLYSIYNSGPNVATGGANLELSTLLGDLFFLQTITVPVFGSNGPLWSLANEFWYYLMFPLLYVMAVTRNRSWRVVVTNAIIFGAICLFIGKWMALSGLIWLVGAASYLVYEYGWFDKFFKTYSALAISIGLLAVSLAFSKGPMGGEFTKDLLIGIAAGVVVLVVARYEGGYPVYRKLAHFCADGSYTMYLAHFPFMALIINVILTNRKFEATVGGYLVFVTIGLTTLLYCYLVYWIFERHTGKLRRYCLSKYKQTFRGPIRV